MGYTAFGVGFAVLGFAAAMGPLVPALARPATDEESLRLYVPEDDEARKVEDFINSHPLTAQLRSDPSLTESRPHMKIPPAFRRQNLTGGTLLGPGRVVVPPFAWNDKDGKNMISIFYVGADLCGHPGFVHGGFQATVLDEGLARCCFAALPNKVGVTANLDINYRKPMRASSYVVLRARTIRVDGRKAYVEGHLETLAAPGETPTVLTEATALYIEPKYAAVRVIFFKLSSPFPDTPLRVSRTRTSANNISRY